MYIMCVCLFSALSPRVGALQISIIIFIKTNDNNINDSLKKKKKKKDTTTASTTAWRIEKQDQQQGQLIGKGTGFLRAGLA